MRVARNLAGVCVVRNARDLIGLVCGHYLRIGLGHVRFIDDGSSDGTYELLSRLARKEKRISVSRVSNAEFRQAELISEVANELLRSGFSIILPFDSDEFWNVSGAVLEKRYARSPQIMFRGQWINFVPSERATNPQQLHLLCIKHSAPILDDADEDTITTFKRPFVCFTTWKIGFKAVSPVELGVGQHALNKGPKECDSIRYQIFHLPFRNRSELIKRALDHEPRRAPLRNSPHDSWQSHFHREAVLAGRTDDLWRANSADGNGLLNCNGESIALNRDHRLQTIILKSYAHVALRYRVLL